MTQLAAIELPRGLATEHSLAECLPRRQSQDCSLAHSERIGRSEARGHLSASLWLTSLQKPGVFEVVPAENVSRFGVQVVAQKFWDPAQLVLISSPPELCVEGSVVYCKKLPGDDYILGIRLGAPVEHWTPLGSAK